MKSGMKNRYFYLFLLKSKFANLYQTIAIILFLVCLSLSNNVFTLLPKHVSNKDVYKKHVSSKHLVCNIIFHTSFCFQTGAMHWFYNFFVLWHSYQILIIMLNPEVHVHH